MSMDAEALWINLSRDIKPFAIDVTIKPPWSE
jgi:hypothetical protein